MFNKIKNNRGNMDLAITLILFIAFITCSGIALGTTGYVLESYQNALELVDVDIPTLNDENATFQNMQDFFEVMLYPMLEVRNTYQYISYFLIFGSIGLLIFIAFKSSKHPIYFVPYSIALIIITYICMVLSNSYESLLNDAIFRSFMVEYSVYNKVMIYLPEFIGFTGVIIGVISTIGIIRTSNQKVEMGVH